MSSITLAYSSTDLSANLAYGSVIARASDYKAFNPVERFEPEAENTIYEPPITMRGRRLEHILYSHYQYPIVIASNDFNADSTKLPFLRTLWRAEFVYICYFGALAWGDFVEVKKNGKAFPIKYEQSIKYLPEVTFNFYGANKI
jgi:hypothetical protein